jgi:hypothetical protein
MKIFNSVLSNLHYKSTVEVEGEVEGMNTIYDVIEIVYFFKTCNICRKIILKVKNKINDEEKIICLNYFEIIECELKNKNNNIEFTIYVKPVETIVKEPTFEVAQKGGTIHRRRKKRKTFSTTHRRRRAHKKRGNQTRIRNKTKKIIIIV